MGSALSSKIIFLVSLIYHIILSIRSNGVSAIAFRNIFKKENDYLIRSSHVKEKIEGTAGTPQNSKKDESLNNYKSINTFEFSSKIKILTVSSINYTSSISTF